MNQDNYSTPVKNATFIPNSTQIPNDYVDKFMAFLTPDEWKILTYAVRRIFGFQRRQDHISLIQFSEGISRRDGTRLDYGTGLSLHSVRRAVRGLVTAGLLIQLAAPKADRTPALYALQLDQEQVKIDFLKARIEKERAGNAGKMAPVRARRKNKTGEQVHATEQVYATEPVQVHATEPDGYTPQNPQYKDRQYPVDNNNALLSYIASLEEEDQKHLESLKALSLREELKKQHAEYFIKQIHTHGQAKVLGYLTWCAGQGHSWAKAYNVDKKRRLVGGWDLGVAADHKKPIGTVGKPSGPSAEQLAWELQHGGDEQDPGTCESCGGHLALSPKEIFQEVCSRLQAKYPDARPEWVHDAVQNELPTVSENTARCDCDFNEIVEDAGQTLVLYIEHGGFPLFGFPDRSGRASHFVF